LKSKSVFGTCHEGFRARSNGIWNGAERSRARGSPLHATSYHQFTNQVHSQGWTIPWSTMLLLGDASTINEDENYFQQQPQPILSYQTKTPRHILAITDRCHRYTGVPSFFICLFHLRNYVFSPAHIKSAAPDLETVVALCITRLYH